MNEEDKAVPAQPNLADPFATEEAWLADVAAEKRSDSSRADHSSPPHGKHERARPSIVLFVCMALAVTSIITSISVIALSGRSDKHIRQNSLEQMCNIACHGVVPDELQVKTTDNGRYTILVYSKRLGQYPSSTLQSQITVYDTKTTNGLPRLIWQSDIEELYDVRIDFPNEWRYHGEQVIMVTRQVGAAASMADVIRTCNGKVMPLERWGADSIELANIDARLDSVLVLHQRMRSNTDVPTLLTWRGSEDDSLVDSSKKFPKYYAKLLAELAYENSLEPDYNVNNEYGKAQLMALAGRYKESTQLLKRLIPQATRENDPDLVSNIRGTLNDLQQGFYSR